MKVNDPNLSPAGSAEAARASETARANAANRAATSSAAHPPSSDDVHLSELVRSLRSLAADSPERQVRIEHRGEEGGPRPARAPRGDGPLGTASLGQVVVDERERQPHRR